MSKISNKTIKALLANSGNKCAFPGCVSPVIDRKYFLVGQLAHIEAASEGGPRYNPEISNLNRHSYDNLMFLCYPHHKEIDSKVNLSQYSVNHLKKMKQQHEELYLHNPFQIDASHIYRITQEINDFWMEISHINLNHPHQDLKFEINTNSVFEDLYKEALEAIERYNNMWQNCVSEEDKKKYWELYNLGMNNHTKSLDLILLQMHVKYLEEFIKFNPVDTESRDRLEQLKAKLKDDAGSAVHWD